MARSGVALAAAMLVVGCTDAYDPYAAEVVADLARHPGDALGNARSGTYEVGVDPGSCDCPTIGALPLCAPANIAAPGSVYFAELVEGDGVLLMRLVTVELVGAIDGDGSFAIGLVQNLDGLAASGEDIMRVDGELVASATALGGEGYVFEGELVRRLQASIADVHVDCEARYPVHGTNAF